MDNKSFRSTKVCLSAFNKQTRDGHYPHHKQEVNGLLAKGLSLLDTPKAGLVFGLGNSNDLSLGPLIDAFKHSLTAIDIDDEALDFASGGLTKIQMSKFKKVIRDISGSSHGDKVAKVTLAVMDNDMFLSRDLLAAWIKQTHLICPADIVNKEFDFISSVCVSTQLLAGISLFIEKAPGRHILMPALGELGNITSFRHVHQVYQLLKKDGVAIIASERYEWHPGSPIASYVKKPIDMMDKGVQATIEAKGHWIRGSVSKDYLLAIGLIVLDEHEWVWDFNSKGRVYYVKGWVVRKV